MPAQKKAFSIVITRGQYERWHPTDELGRFIGQLWIVAKETGKGFGWPYFVFAALPFGLLRRTGGCARHWLLGLTATFVCVGPLMVGLLNPSEDQVITRGPLLRHFFPPCMSFSPSAPVWDSWWLAAWSQKPRRSHSPTRCRTPERAGTGVPCR